MLIVLLAVGVALDLLISLALGYVSLQARNASSSAHVARVALYEACMTTNATLKADQARWQAIITLFGPAEKGTPLMAFIAGVEHANASADQPRDCGQLVP